MYNEKSFQFGRHKTKMNLLKISRYYILRDLQIRRSGLCTSQTILAKKTVLRYIS